MKRALGWVVNIILIWLLVIIGALFLLPQFSGWMFDAVLSGSMEPAFRVGGVIVSKPVEPGEISAGDIIVYRSGETLITHRVVDVIDESELSFITKGDANEDPDMSPVPASSVVGKVFFDLPYVGYLAAFVKTRLGFLLAILLPGLGIIGLELKSLWQGVLKKETAMASPQAESEAAPPKLSDKAPAEDKVAASRRWPLIDRVVIGVVIGSVGGIMAILAIVFLKEVL